MDSEPQPDEPVKQPHPPPPPLPPAPEPGPDGFMDQSTDEVLVISFRVTRFGKDDNAERTILAQKILRELKLHFPNVEPAGLKLVERGGVKHAAAPPPPPKPQPRPSPSRTEM